MGGVQTGSETGSQKLTSQKEVTLSNSGASQSANNGSAASQASSAANSDATSSASTKGSSAASSDAQSSAAVKRSSAATKSAGSVAVSSSDQKSGSQATKSNANSASSSSDQSTQTLNVSQLLKGASALPASALGENKSVSLTADTVTVDNAKDFINVLQNGVATTINIANDINLGDVSKAYQIPSIKQRQADANGNYNITIQSADPSKRYTVDFLFYSFRANNQHLGVTFKNLNLYGKTYFGMFRSAGAYTFDNVDYTGSQLVYVDNAISNTKVTFEGNVNANSVYSYINKFNTDPVTTDPSGLGNQQVLQFNGTRGNTVTFTTGSNVTLTTFNSNVIEIDNGASADIDVQNGATVNLNPHTNYYNGTNPEQFGLSYDELSRGIASGGTTNLNIDKGGTLNINLNDKTKGTATDKADEPDANGDTYHSGALYLNSGATITDNGTLNITSNGKPKQKSDGSDDPVYINGTAKVVVGNGGIFSINATNLDKAASSTDTTGKNVDLITLAGSGTFQLDPHSTFTVSGDGTGNITAINIGNRATFTSDQPKEFNIDLTKNNGTSSLVKNGTIDFTRVKTRLSNGSNSAPMKKINVSYNANGKPTINTISGPNEDGVKAVQGVVNNANAKSVYFTLAGEDVVLNNVYYDSATNTLHGNASSSDGNQGNYITVTVTNPSGSSVGTVKTDPDASESTWVVDSANPNGHNVTTNYQGITDADGNFAIKLVDASGNPITLADSDNINITATRNYVDSETRRISVADAKKAEALAKAKQGLQDALAAESNVEKTHQFYNDTQADQTAYQTAVTAAKTALSGSNLTAINTALTNLKGAYKNLDGDSTSTTDLDNAVSDATTFEKSDDFKDASAADKKAYTDAIRAAQQLQSNKASYDAAVKAAGNDETKVDLTATPYVAQKSVDDAYAAIEKAALQAAVHHASTVKASDAYTKADETNQQKYDDAINAGSQVLAKTDATANDYKTALDNINKAFAGLNGDQNAALTQAKADLQKALTAAKRAKNSGQYNNESDATKKSTFDSDYTTAIGLTDSSDLNAIKNATNALTSATGALTGKETNVDDLKTAIDTANKNAAAIADAAKNNPTTDLGKALKKANGIIDKYNAYQKALSGANNDAANVDTSKTPYVSQSDVDAATTALNNAITDANNAAALQASKKALQDAVNAAPSVRNDHGYYNADEKAQKAYDGAIKVGQSVLDQSNPTKAALDNALKSINDAKDNLNGKATDKTDLSLAVDGANAEKADPNYTAASQAKKDAYDKAIRDGQTVLNTANATQQEVDDAVTSINNAKSDLDGDANKTAAKQAIDDAATAKKQEIDKATNLTDLEKTNLKRDVDSKAQAAKDNIDKATNPDEITSSQTQGVKDIQGVTVPSLADAQKSADDAIDAAAKAKNDAIDSATNLSDADKTNLKQQVTDAVNQAKANVVQATTNDAAKSAGDNGVTAINNITIPTLADKQASANAAVDAALAAKKQQIADANNLNDTEKADLNKQAEDAAETAKTNISNATTDDAVDKAESAGIIAINNVNVPTLAEKQAAAEKAIDQALKAKQDEINNADLTDADKADLNSRAEKAATDAKTAISQATNDDAVTAAEQDGVKAINDVRIPSLADQKKTADAAIDAALAAKKAEIQNASHLTNDEKTALTDTAQKAADQGKAAVDAATNANGVSQAEAAGVLAINDVHVPTLAEQKTKAKQEIADALEAKTNEIKAATNLSSAEQQKLTDAANKAADDANKAIDAATDDNAINTAVSDGIKAINNVNVPSLADHQSAAIAGIKAAQDAKIADIKKATYLTSDESQKLTNEVNQAANDAIAKVKADTTNDAVDADKNAGISNINNIAIPAESKSKTDAKNAIDNAQKAKDANIDGNKDLTNDEKQALKDQVKKAADDAKKNIDNAKTDSDVTKAENAGKDAIDNIQPTDNTAKTDANKAIDDALNKKKNEINNADNLTPAEKSQLTKQATDAANKAKNDIDNATTNDAVNQAKNDGVKAIDDVKVPSIDDAKSDANKAIDDALNKKKNEINNAANLTPDEKDQLTKQATDAANKAKDNISNAKTNDAVNKAESDGLNDINNVKVPSLDDKKSDAKASIDNALKAKDDEIDNAKNLTPAQKNDLKKQAADAADTAKSNIDKATNDADVKKAETNGINAINGIHVPSLQDQKKQAKDAIADALAKKQAEINNAANLAPDEKSDLNNQAQQAADNANKNIDAATDDAAVNKAEQDGLNDINGIHVPSLAEKQNEAKAAIDEAKKAKDDDIDNANNLSDADKAGLKQRVDDAATAAKKAIDAALNDAAVKQAEDKGIADINNIVVASIDAAKKSADDAIDNALNNKQNEINNSNLPQSQKDDLNKQAEDAANKAKDNIDKATTNDGVTKAQNDGVKAIDDIDVPTTPAKPTLDQQKSDANKAIDDALKNKQDEINNSNLPRSQKDDLNQQAEDAAKTAKDNINKATNAGDVTKAQNDGVKAIDDIDVPSTPVNPGESLKQHKADADKTIDKALADKQNEINNSNLNDDQKADLNKQAADAANTAKGNIAKATTADEVSNAVFDGVKAINNVKVPSASEVLNQQKNDADKQIDDALNQKTDQINADSSLNNDQKTALINKANDYASQAKEAINSATDSSAINDALNQGLANIQNLSSADIETNNNQNNGNNNSGIQNGNGSAENTNNGNSANNGAAGELNGNAGAASANAAGAGASSVANGSNGAASLNNGSLNAMANAVKSANANASANTNSKKLPQTGNKDDNALGLMGLAAAGLVGLMGMAAKSGKKED